MKNIFIFTAVAAMAVAGCDTTTNPTGGGGTGTVPTTVVGTWNGTSFIVTNKADTTQVVNLIQGGASLILTIDASGNYTITFTEGTSTDTETGTMTFSGNLVILTEGGSGSPDTSTYSVSGDILIVLFENFAHDFNGDDVEESARARIEFQKDTSAPPPGGGPVPAEVVGTWTTTEFVFINKADTTQKFDLISNGGSFVLEIDADGNFTSTTTFGTFVETETGTLSFSGDQVTITETGEPGSETITYSVSGNTMILVDSDSEFDFDDNGSDDPAILRITLQKG